MFRTPTSTPLSRLARLLPVLAGCLALGCGGQSLYHVSGKATFAGKPIPIGKIYFTPNPAKGNSGATGYADIKDGQFDTAAGGGQGTIGGPMIVRIEGSDGVRIDEERPGGKPLFPSYEKEADLPKSKTTMDFDVPASAKSGRQGGGGTVIVP